MGTPRHAVFVRRVVLPALRLDAERPAFHIIIIGFLSMEFRTKRRHCLLRRSNILHSMLDLLFRMEIRKES